MKNSHLVPTAKQVQLVEDIKACLDIKDFPSCASHYTKANYSNFINTHIDQFYFEQQVNDLDEDWCMELCSNDVWTEYY